MFKRILEPWQEQADAITVEIVATEGDRIVRHNNDIQLHLRQGIEIPLPGNRPTYNIDGELKIVLNFFTPNKVFEIFCWTTSDYDAWRGDFSVTPKLGQRLIADCTDELVKRMKNHKEFVQEISPATRTR